MMNNYKIAREMRNGILCCRTLGVIAAVPAHVVFLLGALALPAFGQASDGILSGTTRDASSGKPVADAQIIVHGLDKGLDRTVVTDSEGSYSLTSLDPGRYELVATKTGFHKSAKQIAVAANTGSRADFALSADNSSALR